MTATQWLEVLTSFSLQVFVVVAVCKLLEHRLVRSADRCSIWNTCFLSILLLAAAAVVLPRLHLVQPWSHLPPDTILSVSTAQAVVGKMLVSVWCVGASVSLIKWFGRAHLLRRLLRRCEPLPEQEVHRLLRATRVSLFSQPAPRLLISDEVQGPFCLQLHHPTVVLPHYLLEGSQDDLRNVLLHEMEHLRTNHPLHLFLEHVTQVVCWFHPAVWKAEWQASLAREFSCDDAVAAGGVSCAAYLRTLLRIAERGEQNKHTTSMAFGRSPSEIVLRAQRLVRESARPAAGKCFRLGRRAATSALVLVACAMTSFWIPSDPLSSSRSVWSPWPKWTAATFHCFGYNVRDYEPFDGRVQPYELQHDVAQDRLSHAVLPLHR